MKYVLVYEADGEYGPENENTIEFATYEDLMAWYDDNHYRETILKIYEVVDTVSTDSLDAILRNRENEKQARRNIALGKLTQAERELLGV